MNRSELLAVALDGGDLAGCDAEGHDLSGAQLGYCRMRGAKLANCGLAETDLHAADLRGADLSHTDLRLTNFSDADMRGAIRAGPDHMELAFFGGAIGVIDAGVNHEGARFVGVHHDDGWMVAVARTGYWSMWMTMTDALRHFRAGGDADALARLDLINEGGRAADRVAVDGDPV